MSWISRICTVLLVLALLFPALSTNDDAISLAALPSPDAADGDHLAALPHQQKSDDDSTLATILDSLDVLHVDAVCALHIEISASPLYISQSAAGSNSSVAVPAGRSPPASF